MKNRKFGIEYNLEDLILIDLKDELWSSMTAAIERMEMKSEKNRYKEVSVEIKVLARL